jgi:sugar phosphate isomerase/epimerase
VKLSIFTKPWHCSIEELADKVAGLGFDGVELPVRAGYQVEPETAGTELYRAARVFETRGLKIYSVAGAVAENQIAACGDAGVEIIRICCPIDMKVGYAGSVEHWRRSFAAAGPALRRSGVRIGVQNHYGYYIASAAGLQTLLDGFDPAEVCAVLDPAHCAVDGEPVDMAVSIIGPKLNGLVNFKSAAHVRTTGPENQARFAVHWTTYRHGGYVWSEFVEALRTIGFDGVACMPAEYTEFPGREQIMGDAILDFVRQDREHLAALLAEGENPVLQAVSG